MIFRRNMVSIFSICLLGLAMLECKNKDESEEEASAVLLLAAAALTQRPAYSFSCNRSGSGFCENIYGTVSGMSQTDCVSLGGTVQTTRCTATSNVGMCTHSATSTRYLEKVYYSGTFTAGTAASNCTSNVGTFSSTYTQ